MPTRKQNSLREIKGIWYCSYSQGVYRLSHKRQSHKKKKKNQSKLTRVSAIAHNYEQMKSKLRAVEDNSGQKWELKTRRLTVFSWVKWKKKEESEERTLCFYLCRFLIPIVMLELCFSGIETESSVFSRLLFSSDPNFALATANLGPFYTGINIFQLFLNSISLYIAIYPLCFIILWGGEVVNYINPLWKMLSASVKCS